MTDRALLQQALEALKDVVDAEKARSWVVFGVDKQMPLKRACSAVAALRERLAQPDADWDWRHPKAQALIGAKARLEIKLRLVEQLVEDPNFETTASDMEYWEPLHDKLKERLAQPEQEPVAWLITDENINSIQIESIQRLIDRARHAHMTDIKLRINGQDEWFQADWLKHLTRTTPPQRKPLTDEEISNLWDGHTIPVFGKTGINPIVFARAIEAKLKEKNNG